jgi:predicted nucleotidyltransferase
MTRNGINLGSEEVRRFCQRWKVSKLSVFGSVLRQDFRADSDVDFLVEFEEDEDWDLFDDLQMQDELSTIIGRESNILTRRAVESAQNPLLRHNILNTAETVCAAR